MHHQFLRILALLFVILVVLQSILGGALFVSLAGWHLESIAGYYGQKSLHGLLETLAPHAIFISVALMGTLHFLGFISTLGDAYKQRLTHLLFGLFIIDQCSPILIAFGWDFFALPKLVAFIGFEGTLAFTWIVLFKESVRDFLPHRLDGQS